MGMHRARGGSMHKVGRTSIKEGSRDRGLAAKGSLKSLTKVNYVLCEAESEAKSGASPNN